MVYYFRMKLLFLGGPGTGKSTVGNRLANDLNWPWISSGAILRESKEQWVIERLKTAQLFDDEMVSELIFSRLSGIENAIIDGYPRTLRQAEIIVDRGLKIDYIVELVVPLKRLCDDYLFVDAVRMCQKLLRNVRQIMNVVVMRLWRTWWGTV